MTVASSTARIPSATRIETAETDRILRCAWYAVALAVAHLKDPDRLGSYFCLILHEEGSAPIGFCHEPVGIVKPEKAEKYFDLSAEKATRLNRMYDERGDLSSWQSRNPDQQQWGGAIIAGGWVLSCSGLPELWDEAVMLATAVISGFLTYADAKSIADISGNARFIEIAITLRWLTPEMI